MSCRLECRVWLVNHLAIPFVDIRDHLGTLVRRREVWTRERMIRSMIIENTGKLTGVRLGGAVEDRRDYERGATTAPFIVRVLDLHGNCKA